jgi:hypothetical protein
MKTALAMIAASSCWLTACVLGGQAWFGVVVRSELAPGAAEKEGVLGVASNGSQLFGHGTLKRGGSGQASYAGGGLPAWVQITWREGDFVQDFQTAGWSGGTIVGDYRVEVARRVPPEVIQHARAGNRAVRLIFRLKDDGVLLAWEVQELVRHPSGASGFVMSMHGGDF